MNSQAHQATPQIVGFMPSASGHLTASDDKTSSFEKNPFLKHFRPLQTLLSTGPQALNSEKFHAGERHAAGLEHRKCQHRRERMA